MSCGSRRAGDKFEIFDGPFGKNSHWSPHLLLNVVGLYKSLRLSAAVKLPVLKLYPSPHAVSASYSFSSSSKHPPPPCVRTWVLPRPNRTSIQASVPRHVAPAKWGRHRRFFQMQQRKKNTPLLSLFTKSRLSGFTLEFGSPGWRHCKVSWGIHRMRADLVDGDSWHEDNLNSPLTVAAHRSVLKIKIHFLIKVVLIWATWNMLLTKNKSRYIIFECFCLEPCQLLRLTQTHRALFH